MPNIFLKMKAQTVKIKIDKKSIELEDAYFGMTEKRINEQDAKIIKSGKDYYVYD